MVKKKPVKKQPPQAQEKSIVGPNVSFEAKLDQAAGDGRPAGGPGSEEVKKDGRGGAREGAGRPKGTDDLSLVNRLPEKANETLIPVLQIPFDFWALSQEIKELALTKDEAGQLALPATQLIEFYFPGRVPEIAWVWLCLLGTVTNIMRPRIELVSRKKKLLSVPGDSGPAIPPSPPPANPVPVATYPTIKDVKPAKDVTA